MTRMRIQFDKMDQIRFISHLDLMRCISRAIRRGKVPVALSQGFNPHHLISMGSALPVGMTSSGEYMDIDFAKEISFDEFKTEMNPVLPAGLELIKGELISREIDSLMAQINIAVYLVRLKTKLDKGGVELLVHNFLKQDQILIKRERKKKIREVDLRPMIRKLQALEVDGQPGLKMKVQTGSKGNARPEEIMAALAEYDGGISEVPLTWMHRQGLYVEQKGRLLTPFEIARI